MHLFLFDSHESIIFKKLQKKKKMPDTGFFSFMYWSDIQQNFQIWSGKIHVPVNFDLLKWQNIHYKES